MAEKITNLDHYLTQEKEALDTVLHQINQLCEHNKKLQGLIEIQKEVKELEKEHTKSLPWFKKLIKATSNIKYVFIKSEEQLTQEAIKRNNDLLKRMDNTILSIADKSAPLKQVLQQEIRKNFDDLAKKDLSKDQRDRFATLFNNEYAVKSEKFSPLTIVNPLHFSNSEKLENQFNILNATKQNIQNLLTENSNIKELKEIQKQVAEIRAEIPYTFFEKLNNNWQKIKNVFALNSEQVLAKNKENNSKIIKKIDEQLYKAGHAFQELINNKKKNINNIISKLPENKKLKEIVNKLTDHIISGNEKILTTQPINKPLKSDVPPPPPMPEQNVNNVDTSIILTAKSDILPPPPPPLPQSNIPPPPPMPELNKAFTQPLLPKALETEAKKPNNQPRPTVDTANLLKQIQEGKKLNKVELDENGKPVSENKTSNEESSDITAALKKKLNERYLAINDSDSERSGSESDSGWASDASTSSNKSKVLKTRNQRNTKPTNAQKVINDGKQSSSSKNSLPSR